MMLSLQSDNWIIGVLDNWIIEVLGNWVIEVLGNWVIEEILIINYSAILIIKIIMANEKSFL